MAEAGEKQGSVERLAEALEKHCAKYLSAAPTFWIELAEVALAVVDRGPEPKEERLDPHSLNWKDGYQTGSAEAWLGELSVEEIEALLDPPHDGVTLHEGHPWVSARAKLRARLEDKGG